MILQFTAYIRPEPQGSAKGFIVQGKNGPRAAITSDNPKMRPFRSEVTRNAMYELAAANITLPMCGKHVPVALRLDFIFRRPDSAKKRRHPSVKPDIDKLCRAVLDSLTGVAYLDDAQVVSMSSTKVYGDVEGVTVTAEEM